MFLNYNEIINIVISGLNESFHPSFELKMSIKK